MYNENGREVAEREPRSREREMAEVVGCRAGGEVHVRVDGETSVAGVEPSSSNMQES